MILKQGIDVKGLQPEILLAVMVAFKVFHSCGYHLVITSALDGKHSKRSKHYIGQAVDLRIRHIGDDVFLNSIVREISHNLTTDYDVVLESDHIHIEYDPKEAQ